MQDRHLAMPRGDGGTQVLTIRVSRQLAQRLTAEARRQRRTRSDVARAALARGLGQETADPFAEARRQSRLVSRRASERDALAFVVHSADLKGWK
jgi:predicted transcriptional regulator